MSLAVCAARDDTQTREMQILVAPDKFKDSLGAREVAECIAAGLRDALPDATIEIVPVADGGEGTAAVICQACAGEWVTCDAHDALGREIQARYVWMPERAMAVMEMSEAAGGWRIASPERDPLRASTFGVGEMLIAASERGAREIIIGLGGSATNDGGWGMARALGFRFSGAEFRRIDSLAELGEQNLLEHPAHLKLARIIAAADVCNPLLGENGATHVFGPQKGADAQKIETLERALTKLADVVSRDHGCDFRDVPGAGAAGGLGFGLTSFCGARLRPGFALVAEILDLESAIQRADVVITGEGKLDRQTLEGKAPAGIARFARKMGKRVFAIVGDATTDRAIREMFDGVFVLADPPITREDAMMRTKELLRERGRELGRTL
jgi:glycerate kinase